MSFQEFIEECAENGMSCADALEEWDRYQVEKAERFREEYDNDPVIQAGWAQQDLIDMYRRER